MNRENLQKLADYLRGPEIAMQFDMSMFCRIGPGFHEVKAKDWKCGTAACAAGHGPAAGIKLKRGEAWLDYSHRAFIPSGDEWTWCFDEDWRFIDNSREGAAARIQWLLDHGLPEDWEDQKYGDAPLCYETVTP